MKLLLVVGVPALAFLFLLFIGLWMAVRAGWSLMDWVTEHRSAVMGVALLCLVVTLLPWMWQDLSRFVSETKQAVLVQYNRLEDRALYASWQQRYQNQHSRQDNPVKPVQPAVVGVQAPESGRL
ncbi:hypothetical protein E3E12_02560 [Formicincola oecophyllae]|uniref:Uncharacterized protein n=1 Tax=Formicincola oecophyllae TaxID=2558361 RepID=A0A4Y6U9N5_9PROT|nr:hypothetical protein [Formicincola oecophyllae]QDH13268.1 hypothetical protein E3E12_02560 [Formicincola oecophyllae]